MIKDSLLYIGRGDTSLDSHWRKLQAKGWQVMKATSQRRGVEFASKRQPAIIIVDGTTPRFSLERLCRQLRQRAPGSPILLLTTAGIPKPTGPYDSLLSKPFTTRKLSSCIKSLSKNQSVLILEAAGLQLDLSSRRLKTPEKQYTLTPKEFELLFLFMQRPGQILSRRDIMENVWHTTYLGDTRTLDVHIRWLRQKIERNPSRPHLLRTCRGVGYVLTVDQKTAHPRQ